MKRTPLIYLVAAIFTLVTPRTDYGRVIQRIDIPIDAHVAIPCAAGGQGEIVALSGEVQMVFIVTSDASGGLHVETQSNNQGVSGIGTTTGDKYQGTGGNRFSSNTNGASSEITFVNRFQLIGQGPGNNLAIHETVHVTVNANGDVTASILSFDAECK